MKRCLEFPSGRVELLSSKKERRRRRQEEKRRKKSSAMALPLIGLSVVVLAGGWFVNQMMKSSVGTAIPVQPTWHISSPDTTHPPYNSLPPTSGPHLGSLARWGIHQAPIPDEMQVHNLEDGGVLVQYRCRNCGRLIQQLEQVVRRYDRYVILAPNPRLDKTIALTAWGRIDKFDEFGEKRIVRFIEAYKGIDHHR